MSVRVEDWVLELLRCPRTGQVLHVVQTGGETFLATPDGIRYPVVDGVPVLLVDAGLDAPALDDAALDDAEAADPA